MAELAEWLRVGASVIEREQRLWRAIKACPTGPSFPPSTGNRASNSALLARMRPNGYAAFVAPLLRGIPPNGASLEQNLQQTGLDESLRSRIEACFESLIGDVDIPRLGCSTEDGGAQATGGILGRLSAAERNEWASKAEQMGGNGLAPSEMLPWAVRMAVEGLEALRVRQGAWALLFNIAWLKLTNLLQSAIKQHENLSFS